MESNYKNYASVYAMLSIKLKFYMCIVYHCSSTYISLSVNRIYSFFTEYTQCRTLRPKDAKYLNMFNIVKLMEFVQN